MKTAEPDIIYFSVFDNKNNPMYPGIFDNEKTKLILEKPKIKKIAHRPKKLIIQNRIPLKEFLFNRDGNLCFYSGRPMTHTTATIEHLIAKSVGGGNARENLVLSLAEHNNKVGNASLKEKIEYRNQLIKSKTDEGKEVRDLRIELNNSQTLIKTLQEKIKNQKEHIQSLPQKIRTLNKQLEEIKKIINSPQLYKDEN